MLGLLKKKEHQAVRVLQTASLAKSSPKDYAYYWAFRHPNEELPPETFRLSRRDGAGWFQLLVASRETKEVFNFQVESAEDKQAVLEALKWFGISGSIVDGAEGPALRLANGTEVPSLRWGGEKPKKR